MSDLLVIIVLAVPLFVLWAGALWDVLQSRHDLTRPRRALWVLAVLLLPIIGLAAYLLTRPPHARFSRPLADEYVEDAARIVAVAERHQRGELTDDEYRSEIRSLKGRVACPGPGGEVRRRDGWRRRLRRACGRSWPASAA